VAPRFCGAQVAAVNSPNDPPAGSFEFCDLAEAEVALDRGEFAAQAVVGEGVVDPAGEVAAGQVVAEDGRVAVPELAAELFHGRGCRRLAAGVEVEPAVGRERAGCVLVLVAHVRADPVVDGERPGRSATC
jgi:hypothetical protein